MLVDSHCHLDRLDYDGIEGGVAGVLACAAKRDISHFLCVSIHLEQFTTMLDTIAPFDNVFASCGVHPLNQEETFEYSQLLSLADDARVVAVGETGLDYFYAKQTAQLQREAFASHIQCANELNKPLIIHTRDACEDTINIMDANGADKVGGVFHCFTEDWQMRSRVLNETFIFQFRAL